MSDWVQVQISTTIYCPVLFSGSIIQVYWYVHHSLDCLPPLPLPTVPQDAILTTDTSPLANLCQSLDVFAFANLCSNWSPTISWAPQTWTHSENTKVPPCPEAKSSYPRLEGLLIHVCLYSSTFLPNLQKQTSLYTTNMYILFWMILK